MKRAVIRVCCCHSASNRIAIALLVTSFTIAIPYSTLYAQPVSLPDGWVVLPDDDYRALRQRANPSPPAPPTPVVAAALSRVDYDLRVEGESVTGRAQLTVDVLREGWTTVAIPPGLMTRQAQVDGRPVALVPGTHPHVLLSRVGRSLVTLDIVLPLTTGPGTESIVVPQSPAPISRVALALPRSGVTLTTTDGFVSGHTETGDESRWVAYGRPHQPLSLTWRRKVDDRRSELPLRVRARISQLIGLGEELGQLSASVRVEVLQGLARELLLAIPPTVTVAQVDGPTVADWDATSGSVRVRFLEPVAGEVSFVVQGDVRTARQGSISVPLVRLPSAERETGGVAIDVLGSGELAERQSRGMDPTDVSDLGDIVAGRESPSMAAFRFRPMAGSDSRALSISVVRYTPQAVLIANVEEARYRTLMSEDGRLLVEARYAIRNNQRAFLKVTLPEGATLWSADVAGRPIRPGVADASGVLLPLEKGRAGEEAPTFTVALMYLQRTLAWDRSGSARLELPALDLPVSRTGVEFNYSPRFRVEPLPGAFRVEQNIGPTAEAFTRPPIVDANSVAAPPPTASRLSSGLQALVDRFKTDAGGRTSVGTLPVQVAFPDFGSSVFLAAELTPEANSPALAFAFKRIRD